MAINATKGEKLFMLAMGVSAGVIFASFAALVAFVTIKIIFFGGL